MNRHHRRHRLAAGVLTALMVVTMTVVMAPAAPAHDDPNNCDANNIGAGIEAFVDRGSGLVKPPGGVVFPGEQIIYRATLAVFEIDIPGVQDQTACNVESGQLSVTHPDGTVVELNGFPDVDDNPVPLISLGNSYMATLSNDPYTVDCADNGQQGLKADVDYGSASTGQINGIFHDGPDTRAAAATAGNTLTCQRLDAEPVTTIHDANHDPVLVVEVGTTVHDSVLVEAVSLYPGHTGPTPTGTATFDWRETFDCSGQPADQSNALGLTGGAVDATGFTQTPTAPGGYSFRALYSGDTNYNSATSACEPLDVVDLSILIEGDGVNEVGDAHDFTVTVTEHGQAGDNPVAGASPTVSFPGTGAPGTVDDSDCADGTNASGQCTVTINSDVTGTFTAVASVTHSVNGISMTRTTDGNSGQADNSDATKVYVDARIRVTPDGVNEVGDAHTFTVLVEADDGSGAGWQGVSGVVPQITANPTPDSLDTSDCDNGTDANGECTVVVNHGSPVHVEVDASATFEISTSEGPLEVTRSTTVDNGNVSPDIDPDVTGEKDWVDLSIAVAPDGLNEVGDAHVFTVTVTGHTPDGDEPVDDGTPVSITWSPSAPSQVDNGCANGTSGGTCTVTVNSPEAGAVTINVSTTATVEGVQMTRSTAGNAGPAGSGPAAKRWVDGSITITPDGVNEVTDPHTFTVSTLVDDGTGTGPVAPPDGTNVTVTIIAQGNTPPAQVVANDCGDNGTSGGSCTVTINSDATGVYVVSATFSHTFAATEIEGDDVTISRTTDGTGANSGPATKRYVDAVVRIDPDGVNLVNDPHTFAVEVMADLGDGEGWVAHPASVSVRLTDTDGASSTVDTDGTTCGIDPDFADADSATCDVVFTSATTGFTIGHATATLDVLGVDLTRETDGTAVIDGEPNDDAVKEWVEVEVLPEVLEKTGTDSLVAGLVALLLIGVGWIGVRMAARQRS